MGAENPQNAIKEYDFLSQAKKTFEKTFKSKTSNDWQEKDSFEAIDGKYTLLDVSANVDSDDDATMHLDGAEEEEPAESELSEDLQSLMGLMCNKALLKETLLEMDLDIEKFPLGKLSKSQVDVGYEILSKLQEVLIGDASTKAADVLTYSNKFYTSIPHNFGMRLPPPIDSLEILKQKIEMLEVLGGIECSRDLMQSTQEYLAMNPLDRHYQALRTELTPLEADSSEVERISKMVSTTHAATHDSYKLNVKKIFSVKREFEERRFKPFRKLHNRRMLWHGSRLSNMAGILSKGLRIAPPEAPSTGYMFGKGLYFADSVSKSANYCRATRTQNRVTLLLCEVACGDMYPCKSAEFLEKAPHGYHSTTGVGKQGLDAANEEVSEDGSVTCTGPLIANEEAQDSALMYNEFIVYDVNQVRIAYLVEVELEFTDGF